MLRRKNPLIYQINKTFYAKQDFVGRLFKIDTIYLDQYIDGRFVRPEFSLNKEYVRITGVLGKENLQDSCLCEDQKKLGFHIRLTRLR